jgi:GDP-4-dehydro-6-deoxy-D-mannose reductase
MKILVTGSNGFAGSHLLDHLLTNNNNKIYGLVKVNARMRNVKHLVDKVNFVEGDLTDPVSINNLIKLVKPDLIYHLGALSWVSPSWNMPSAYFNVNAIGTINLFEAVRSEQINPKILVSCTPEEFGDVQKEDLPITEKTKLDPVNHYAASKVAQEAICQSYFASYKMKIVRCRAFNHEGPRRDINGAIASFAYQIARIENELQNNIIEVGNLSAQRNFTHVVDMVKAYTLAMDKGKDGELYLISSNMIFTIKQVLEKLISFSKNKKITYKIAQSRVRPTELNYLVADCQKFINLTNWKIEKSMDNILEDTLNYWRSFVKDKLY